MVEKRGKKCPKKKNAPGAPKKSSTKRGGFLCWGAQCICSGWYWEVEGGKVCTMGGGGEKVWGIGRCWFGSFLMHCIDLRKLCHRAHTMAKATRGTHIGCKPCLENKNG